MIKPVQPVLCYACSVDEERECVSRAYRLHEHLNHIKKLMRFSDECSRAWAHRMIQEA